MKASHHGLVLRLLQDNPNTWRTIPHGKNTALGAILR
jgi:hypothetical protein